MQRILVIDNYDSFTFNLVQYLGMLGAEVVVRRHDALTLEDVDALSLWGVVISPGPRTPKDAGISSAIVKRFSGHLPILGVCLGHQVIATSFGGTVTHAKALVHGKTSPILHEGTGLFDGIPNPFRATRYHSLAVEETNLPSCLQVRARTEDQEIMALAHRSHPTVGIQFHPESILTEHGINLLDNWLKHKLY